MYCTNCGKHNPEGSKYCQHCGIKCNDHGVVEVLHSHKTDGVLSSDNSPYPYVISISKLIILSTATFGIYEAYWFYKQWKSFKAERDLHVTPWVRAVFATLMAYSLFTEVSKALRSVDKTSRGLEAGGLAVAYFVLVYLWKLPEPYWWLSMLSVLPLIPVQGAINSYWEKKYGEKIVRSGFGAWNYIWTVIGGIVLLLALYGTFGVNNAASSNSQNNSTINAPANNTSSDTPESPTPIIDAFKTDYQSSFVQSCEKGASGAAVLCNCMANYLITNYTDDQLTQITQQYQSTGQTPQALTDAANACVSTSNQNTNAGSSQ